MNTPSVQNHRVEWWRWVEGGAAAVLVLALLALRFDTLKDRPGWTAPRALRRLLPFVLFVPAVFLVATLGPWWLGLLAIAIPGLAVLVMAATD